jgi:hypothetical protein
MSLLLVFSAPCLPYITHSSGDAMPLRSASGVVPIFDPMSIFKLHRGPSGREKANCNQCGGSALDPSSLLSGNTTRLIDFPMRHSL